jgi:CRP-like cAMP-binding protein
MPTWNNYLDKVTHFSDAHMEALYRVMTWKQVKQGSILFREGDFSPDIYYVQRGNVKFRKTTSVGTTLTLAFYRSGDFIGQWIDDSDSIHPHAAETTTDCTIGILSKQALTLLFKQNFDLMIEFVRLMNISSAIMETKLRDLLLFGKPGALSSLLIRLSNTFGQLNPEGHILIDYKLTNQDIAEMIGATRESVNRMLRELKQQDVIEFINSKISIKNLTYLRDQIHCDECPTAICRM